MNRDYYVYKNGEMIKETKCKDLESAKAHLIRIMNMEKEDWTRIGFSATMSIDDNGFIGALTHSVLGLVFKKKDIFRVVPVTTINWR